MSPRPSLPIRLEYAMLGLIRRKPVHGYDLLQKWQTGNGIGLVWRVKPGRLYAGLEKLEALGYIQGELRDTTSPQKREFMITLSGEKAFLNWMRSPVLSARDFRQDFLFKVFFAGDVNPHDFRLLLDDQLKQCKRWLESLQNQSEKHSGFEEHVILFRIRQVEGIIAWMQNIDINTLNKEI